MLLLSVLVAIVAWLLRKNLLAAISTVGDAQMLVFSSQVDFQDPTENLIAACAVFYSRLLIPAPRKMFRWTDTPSPPKESLESRLFCAMILGWSAFHWRAVGFPTLCALQIASYIFGLRSTQDNVYLLLYTFFEALAAFAVAMFFFVPWNSDRRSLLSIISSWCWANLPFLASSLTHMFPVKEFTKAYQTTTLFMPDFNNTNSLENTLDYSPLLQQAVCHTLYVTVNIQIAIGFVGIAYLDALNTRKIALMKINDTPVTGPLLAPTERARGFMRLAVKHIFFVGVPYMLHRITMENVDMFAFKRVQNHVHNHVRQTLLFQNKRHFVSMNDLPHSPDAYASSIDTVTTTIHQLTTRKLFSIPKIMLLPRLFVSKPRLMAIVLPCVFAMDFAKSNVMSYLTSTVETLTKEQQKLESERRSVEEYDLQRADIIARSGIWSLRVTKESWLSRTQQIQLLDMKASILKTVRNFFRWLYWQDALMSRWVEQCVNMRVREQLST